jgi:ABC-type multidrug transport system permease subunit
LRRLRHDLRVIRSVAWKDLRLAMTQRALTIVGLLVPINLLLLFILFAISGGQAPTAVVVQDQGPLAARLVDAMAGAHSFQLRHLDAATAERQLRAGEIVAVVTVPASFDADVRAGRTVALPVDVNNLNTDQTNDIRRAVPLSITSFYADALPGQVVVRAREIDDQANDTSYVSYLGVGVVVSGLMVQGVLQASLLSAREYEDGTIKELLLAPASRWAVAVGKVGAGLALTAAAGLLVTAVVVFVLGVRPAHPWEVLGTGLLLMVPFVALGVLVGTLLRRRQPVVPLALGIFLPAFFLSGPFGPPNWSGPVVGAFSLASPLTYAIALFQHAFHGYRTAQPAPGTDVLVLVAFALAAVAAAALVLRRSGAVR